MLREYYKTDHEMPPAHNCPLLRYHGCLFYVPVIICILSAIIFPVNMIAQIGNFSPYVIQRGPPFYWPSQMPFYIPSGVPSFMPASPSFYNPPFGFQTPFLSHIPASYPMQPFRGYSMSVRSNIYPSGWIPSYAPQPFYQPPSFPGGGYYAPPIGMSYPFYAPLTPPGFPNTFSNPVNRLPNSFTPEGNDPLPRPKDLLEYPIPDDVPESRKEAIKEALDWIFRNPSPVQTSALEAGEEIMLFYQLYRLAHTQDAKDLVREYIRIKIKEVVNSGRLENPTPGEVTVLIPVCEIMVKLGLSLFDYHSFINQKVYSNPDTFTSPYRIWNSTVLEKMGFPIPIPVMQLVNEGGIITELRSGQLMNMLESPTTDPKAIMQRFYAITHEILPLGNFGETHVTLLQPNDIILLQNLVARGILYYLEHFDLDLIGELAISAHMLGLQDETLLNEAFESIMDHQLEDGSFGTVDRYIHSGRSNPLRHFVFVGIWALIQ